MIDALQLNSGDELQQYPAITIYAHHCSDALNINQHSLGFVSSDKMSRTISTASGAILVGEETMSAILFRMNAAKQCGLFRSRRSITPSSSRSPGDATQKKPPPLRGAALLNAWLVARSPPSRRGFKRSISRWFRKMRRFALNTR